NKGNYVFAGSVNAQGQGTCTADQATLNDPTKCKPCTPVVGCQNTCAHCELCFGGAPLPPDCFTTPDMAGQPPSADMAGRTPAAAAVPDGRAGVWPAGPGAVQPGLLLRHRLLSASDSVARYHSME